MSIETELTALRDDAYLNAAVLSDMLETAEAQFQTIRTWPDSPTKRELLNQLASTISGLRHAHREASALYANAAAALLSVLDAGDPVPPLPITGGQVGDHVQMHVESTPGLLPANALFGRYYATEDLELDAALSGMVADVASTNVSVLPVKIGAVTVARATFNPGDVNAVIDVLVPAVVSPALLTFWTPELQDPTLSGVVGTFVGLRV